jgi:hypothetical protein
MARMSSRGCTACLETTTCWVCLGAGVLELRAGQIGPCHRCYGSGLCAGCQPIRIIDLDLAHGHDVEIEAG